MIRYYCDVCGEEIPRELAGKRLKREKGIVRTETITAVNGLWNAGQVCEKCLINVLVNGTDWTGKRIPADL